MFLGSFIEGLTGSFATIMALCLAYIIDTTDKESRSFRIGVIDIIASLAATASFFVSGVWLKVSGLLYYLCLSFWINTKLSFGIHT